MWLQLLRTALYLSISLISHLLPVNGSAVPLTALKTEHKCHQPSLNFINLTCGLDERIRLLDSFYGVGVGQCQQDTIQASDCKSFTNQFENFCNGRRHCQIEFLRIFLPKCQAYSSYLVVRYECVPGDFKETRLETLNFLLAN